MFSKELELSIASLFDKAHEANIQYITVEHLLLMILNDFDVIDFFILPPSKSELKRRLIKRGRDNKKERDRVAGVERTRRERGESVRSMQKHTAGP